MRVFYIIAIVFAFFFTIIMTAATVGTASEKRNYTYNYDLYEYDYGKPSYVESTEIAAGISFVYFVFAFALYIVSLIALKTTLARIFAIIGLSLTFIMTIWGIIVAGNPRSITFDEVGGAWVLYGLITLAISIIGTIQAFKYQNQQRAAQTPQSWPPYGNPYPPYPPQQPYNQGYPPYNQPPYPPQQPPGQAPWIR